MNDEAINSICNTLLSIKSDIRELKQNYNTLKDEHMELKECFDLFKTQIQKLSETIRDPEIGNVQENTQQDIEIVRIKINKKVSFVISIQDDIEIQNESETWRRLRGRRV